MPSSVAYSIKEGDTTVFPDSAAKHSKQGEYEGMTPTRSTTDIIFLLAIIGRMIVILGINISSFKFPLNSRVLLIILCMIYRVMDYNVSCW